MGFGASVYTGSKSNYLSSSYKSSIMKWIYLFALFFCCTYTTYAQSGTSDAAIALPAKLVRQAIRLRDYPTAIAAIHNIIAIEGPQSTWRDSLLTIYFQSGNYLSSHLLATELLSERSKDDRLLEISANCLAQLGAFKESIAAYEILYPRTKRVDHAYELANLQYQIKRLAEAEGTLTQLLASEISDSLRVAYPTPQGGRQVVGFKAAAYNLKGMVAFDLKQIPEATAYFKKALELNPDFEMAKQNASAILVANNQTKASGTEKVPAAAPKSN